MKTGFITCLLCVRNFHLQVLWALLAVIESSVGEQIGDGVAGLAMCCSSSDGQCRTTLGPTDETPDVLYISYLGNGSMMSRLTRSWFSLAGQAFASLSPTLSLALKCTRRIQPAGFTNVLYPVNEAVYITRGCWRK
jgi:hypothetical protein